MGFLNKEKEDIAPGEEASMLPEVEELKEEVVEEKEEETTDEPEEEKKEEPKTKIIVVKELPVQNVRESIGKDGTPLLFMTVEEALGEILNA